jgi:Uma2 family endonuclease
MLALPLTPEIFLEPQLEDQIPQGECHSVVRTQLAVLLRRHFGPDSLVLVDVQHDFGVPGLPRTGPDISVVLRARPGNRTRFSVRREGVRPELIIEILCPFSAQIRRVDEVDKVEIYEKAAIPEYLIVDLPRRANRHRFTLTGYRLDRHGLYRPIEPDDQGRLLFKVTGLWFTVSLEGDKVLVFDQKTGERLLYSEEEGVGRKAAEAARDAAEAENARLREELERLKRSLESRDESS